MRGASTTLCVDPLEFKLWLLYAFNESRTMECVVFAQLRSMAPSAVRKLWSLLGTPLAACEAGRR